MRNEEGFVGEGSKETLVSKDDDEVEADEGDDSHLDWRNGVEVSSRSSLLRTRREFETHNHVPLPDTVVFTERDSN